MSSAHRHRWERVRKKKSPHGKSSGRGYKFFSNCWNWGMKNFLITPLSVGLLWSIIGHAVSSRKGKWPGSVWEEFTDGEERHWNEINRTKGSKAFTENQRIIECYVEAGLQALISQLWSIHWTLCWKSGPHVKDGWMGEEKESSKSNWSEFWFWISDHSNYRSVTSKRVILECPRWNASARWVSPNCPSRAGCRTYSHFYHIESSMTDPFCFQQVHFCVWN